MEWCLDTGTNITTINIGLVLSLVTHSNGLPAQRLLASASERIADADCKQQYQHGSAEYEREQQTVLAIVALQQRRGGVTLREERRRQREGETRK